MPLLEKWTPLRELDVFDRSMRRLFGELGVPGVLPAADVYEADGELVVELEVPGFDEKELSVELTDHTLSISGERKEEKERRERALQLHERLERTFRRRFELPSELDSSRVRAEYSKGVLSVHVPKGAPAQQHTIEIHKA